MADVTDNFDRADGALNGSWTQLVGGQGQFVVITGNQVASDTPGSYVGAAWTANQFTSNQFSSAVVAATAEGFGLVVRAQTAVDRQFYWCHTAFGNIYIGRQEGSDSFELAAAASPAWQIGDVIAFVATDSNLSVLRNAVPVLATSDTTYLGGAPGVFFRFGSASARLDDWVGGPTAGGVSEPASRRMTNQMGGLTGGMQARRNGGRYVPPHYMEMR